MAWTYSDWSTLSGAHMPTVLEEIAAAVNERLVAIEESALSWPTPGGSKTTPVASDYTGMVLHGDTFKTIREGFQTNVQTLGDSFHGSLVQGKNFVTEENGTQFLSDDIEDWTGYASWESAESVFNASFWVQIKNAIEKARHLRYQSTPKKNTNTSDSRYYHNEGVARGPNYPPIINCKSSTELWNIMVLNFVGGAVSGVRFISTDDRIGSSYAKYIRYHSSLEYLRAKTQGVKTKEIAKFRNITEYYDGTPVTCKGYTVSTSANPGGEVDSDVDIVDGGFVSNTADTDNNFSEFTGPVVTGPTNPLYAADCPGYPIPTGRITIIPSAISWWDIDSEITYK